MTRKRVGLHLLIGVGFGIGDWYFIELLMWLIRISSYHRVVDLLGFVANWGIWLVAAVPIALGQVRRSQSALQSGLAVMIVWMTAIVAYYLYYAFLLAFVGLPHMEDLLLRGPRPEGFAGAWSATFQTLIVGQIREWIGVACIGGLIVGWSTATLYLRTQTIARRSELA